MCVPTTAAAAACLLLRLACRLLLCRCLLQQSSSHSSEKLIKGGVSLRLFAVASLFQYICQNLLILSLFVAGDHSKNHCVWCMLKKHFCQSHCHSHFHGLAANFFRPRVAKNTRQQLLTN
jgi:hypothetical protein